MSVPLSVLDLAPVSNGLRIERGEFLPLPSPEVAEVAEVFVA